MKEPREEINEELKRLDEISDVFLENMDLKHELAKAKDRIKELEESERKLISHIRGFILGSVSKNKLKRLINPYEQFNPRIGKQR